MRMEDQIHSIAKINVQNNKFKRKILGGGRFRT